MAYVNSVASAGGIVSGQTIAITGVTSGDGLVLFCFFDSTTTSATISDSSGTTWALNGSYVQMSVNGEAAAVYTPTSAVGAGTHTLTITFTGGANVFPFLFEDTNNVYGTVVGRDITAPGAGQTLTPGGTVGTSGEVLMGAFDAAVAGAVNQPVVGSGGFTSRQAGNNAAIGSWLMGENTAAGGTTPSFSPGTAGAADETGVLALALTSSGGGGTFSLAAANGAYVITGEAATFVERFQLTAAQGSYTLTGEAATEIEGFKLSAGQGSYSVTGEAATLVTAGSFNLVAANGSYSIAGQSSVLGTAMLGAQGSYVLAGEAATFGSNASYTLVAAAGAYDYVGAAASSDFSMEGLAGAYTLAGQAAVLSNAAAFVLTAAVGNYSLAGQAVVFSTGGIGTYLLVANPGSYSYTGEQLIFPGGQPPAYGQFNSKNWKVFEISTTGKVAWVDYLPIVYESAQALEINRTDDIGAIGVNKLTSVTGLVAWVDYMPVAQVASPTRKWSTDDNGGFIPCYRLS